METSEYLQLIEDRFYQIIDPVTIGALIATILGAYVLIKISDKVIKESVNNHNGSTHAYKTAQKVSKIIISSIALLAVLGLLGVPASAIGTFLGLLALGASFALRDIIANFISGILILTTRPFKINDQISTSDESGVVEDIRIRATDIRTYDGRKVIVPNSDLYNKTVVNNTAYDNRRFDVLVGIGYDDDIKKAKELALETLDEAENVKVEPEPQVLVDELADSSVTLKLRGWTSTRRSNVLKASSEVTELLKEKYDEAGIDIPYPIRTVYMEEDN